MVNKHTIENMYYPIPAKAEWGNISTSTLKKEKKKKKQTTVSHRNCFTKNTCLIFFLKEIVAAKGSFFCFAFQNHILVKTLQMLPVQVTRYEKM